MTRLACISIPILLAWIGLLPSAPAPAPGSSPLVGASSRGFDVRVQYPSKSDTEVKCFHSGGHHLPIEHAPRATTRFKELQKP